MKVSGRSIFGIIVVIIGILLFLGSLGIVDAGDYIRDYWPVIMILFGVYSIIDRDSSTFFGLILILIGGYIQLEKLDYVLFDHISLGSLIFPTIVVLVGLKLIVPERKV